MTFVNDPCGLATHTRSCEIAHILHELAPSMYDRGEGVKKWIFVAVRETYVELVLLHALRSYNLGPRMH